MLALFDNLAARWLAWRTEQHIRRHAPQLAEFSLHKLAVTPDGNGYEGTWVTPAAAMIADVMATMLDGARAENYVQFDFMPRLDHGLRPVRVTVQWARGEAPATRAARLATELADANATITGMVAALTPILPLDFQGDNPVWACGKLRDAYQELAADPGASGAAGKT